MESTVAIILAAYTLINLVANLPQVTGTRTGSILRAVLVDARALWLAVRNAPEVRK